MTEKFIEIKDGIYVVTDGNFKIMKGHFTEEELKEIYQLAQKIETIKEEKKYYEKEIANVQLMKNNAKNVWTVRPIPMLTCLISLTASGISHNLFGTIFLLLLCTGFQILVEKGIKMVCGTKKEREEREKSATTMLESLNHHLKVHEKTLEERKEKTQYKEIPYEGDRIIKPVFDEVYKAKTYIDNTDLLPKEETWDDVLYTEEEIHQYMQMPEASAIFNPETIFDSTEPVKEQSGPRLVKKRILPKQNN